MTHRLPPGARPTQIAQPRRAVTRSSAAALVGVLPILWPLVNRELGPYWATAAVVAAVAGNAIVTRLLAYPAVEAFLRDVLPGLAADKPEPRHGRLDLAAPPAAVFASSAEDTVTLDYGGPVHASANTRIVGGLVLPWNQAGPTTAGVLTIAPGGVRLPRDLGRLKLHFKHSGTDGHKPVGHCIGYEVRPEGLYCRFSVARTPDGDAAMQQVTEHVYDAFSAELASMIRNGSTVTDSVMTGVALVDTPAFANARVQEVHAARSQGETMNVLAYLLAMIAAGATEAEARAAAAARFDAAEIDAVSSAELAAQTDGATIHPEPTGAEISTPAAEPEASAAAAYTPGGLVVPAGLGTPPAATVAHASSYAAAQTVVKMVRHEPGIAHAALTDITASSMVDATPPAWLGELWSGPAKTRRLVPLLNRRDLHSWRIQGFRWVDKPVVKPYAGDKTEIPTGPVSIEPYEAEASRWAVGHDLDRKFWDFGDAGILDAYWRTAHESYAVVTDAAAGAFVVANATAQTDAAATDLTRAMISLSAAVDDALGVPVNYYLANPADRYDLLATTSQNLPTYLDLFGVDPRQIVWTKAVPAGTLVAGAKPAVTFYELPGSPLRVEAEHLSLGGRDRALFGYTAMTVDNGAGLVKIAYKTGV